MIYNRSLMIEYQFQISESESRDMENIAKKTKNKVKLNNYINWAERYIDHSPYLFIYYDLATAYEALGNGEKAWEVYRYAQHLYPGAKWREEDNSNIY